MSEAGRRPAVGAPLMVAAQRCLVVDRSARGHPELVLPQRGCSENWPVANWAAAVRLMTHCPAARWAEGSGRSSANPPPRVPSAGAAGRAGRAARRAMHGACRSVAIITHPDAQGQPPESGSSAGDPVGSQSDPPRRAVSWAVLAQPVAMSASTARVNATRSPGASSTCRPRLPALTMMVGKALALESITVGSAFR